MEHAPQPFFIAGGTLAADTPSYVEREADRLLLDALRRGEFCYLLDTRQVGKSSLMVRAAAALRAEGHRVALLDLTQLGQSLTLEQWYYGLLMRLGQQIGCLPALRSFWRENPDLGPVQRWFEAVRENLTPRPPSLAPDPTAGPQGRGSHTDLTPRPPSLAPDPTAGPQGRGSHTDLTPRPPSLAPDPTAGPQGRGSPGAAPGSGFPLPSGSGVGPEGREGGQGDRSGSLVVFVDEIDAVLNLPFSADEFFAAIRECFTRRAEDPAMARLTFCLIGSSTPDTLIRDVRTTPFNIGTRVAPADFTLEEAAPLAAGLGGDGGRKTEDGQHRGGDRERESEDGPSSVAGLPSPVLRRILHWTHGHPYLTQRLCAAVAEEKPDARPEAVVDRACTRVFFSAEARKAEPNLAFVGSRVLRSGEDVAGLLDLYARARTRRGVPDDPASPLHAVLRLSGLVRVVDGRLRVRNRIYERVFGPAWIRENLPDAEARRQRAAVRTARLQVGAVALAVLLVVWGLAWKAATQAREAQINLTRAVAGEKLATDKVEEARRNLVRATRGEQLAQKRAEEARRNLKRATGSEALARRKADEAAREAAEARRQRTLAQQALARATASEARAKAEAGVARAAEGRASKSARAERAAAVRAREEEEKTGRLLYIANINLVQQAWEATPPHAARVAELLAETRGSPFCQFEWGYWQRMLHLEQLSLQGHAGSVTSVAFSADGWRIVTGSRDGTASSVRSTPWLWNTGASLPEAAMGRQGSGMRAPVAVS